MVNSILLTFALQLFQVAVYSGDCNNLDASIKITHQASGSQVKIIPSGGSRPYKILFFKDSGQLVSDDFSKQDHPSVVSGKYSCIVIDKNNCKKRIDFEVP